MQPSSVIFLVIIAIWAVYLVQHWIRRREHLATARSVDRFSEAMRVLDVRKPLPQQGLSPRRSYAAPAARPARPVVAVKRAEPVSRQVEQPVVRQAPRQISRPQGMAVQRALAVLLLLAVMAVPVTALLSWREIAPWTSVLVALGVTVLLLGLLVTRARARRRRRRVQRLHAQPVVSSAPRRTRAVRARDIQAQQGGSGQPVGVAPTTETAQAAGSTATASAGIPVTEAALVDQPAAPGTWQPTPVPKPTYQLKEQAFSQPRPTPTQLTVDPVAERTSYTRAVGD